jgi:hypothetical protein
MEESKPTIGDAPIADDVRDLMNALARILDQSLNGPVKHYTEKKNGFVLMVFPFDGHEGRCNYISNANRDEVVVMMKHQVARFEGQPDIVGRA